MRFKHLYYLIIILGICIISACQMDTVKEKDQATENPPIRGVWKLLSYQPQNDTSFQKMEGVEIQKTFTKGTWISAAYRSTNKQVVHLTGGTYTYKDGIMYETIGYNLKDTVDIGLLSIYKVVLMGDTLYQSGVFKENTPEAYKVEEYWIKLE